jgi:uncharacterized protein (DUF2267 family)
MSEPSIIDRSAQQARIWLDDLAEELGVEDRGYAYRVLRAYLHAIRDRIGVNEAVQLGAQLPLLIRGIYYDGWVPARTPADFRTVDELLTRIAEEARLGGETEASAAFEAASAVLRRHVTAGEIEDVIAVLPAELKPLLAAPEHGGA